MRVTNQEATKLMTKIEERIAYLKCFESKSSVFVAATTENIEDVRPEYNFWTVRNEITEQQSKIRDIKHAINVFNVETKLPGTEITIDKALVLLPQLRKNLTELAVMKAMLPKERKIVSGNVIDYRYANYNIKDAEDEYNTTLDLITKIQNLLNLVNSTVYFDIPD